MNKKDMKEHLKNLRKYIKFQEDQLTEHKKERQENQLLHTDYRMIGLKIMLERNKRRYEKEVHIYNEISNNK